MVNFALGITPVQRCCFSPTLVRWQCSKPKIVKVAIQLIVSILYKDNLEQAKLKEPLIIPPFSDDLHFLMDPLARFLHKRISTWPIHSPLFDKYFDRGRCIMQVIRNRTKSGPPIDTTCHLILTASPSFPESLWHGQLIQDLTFY